MNESKNKYLPWIVCLSSALFFFYEHIQMQMFNSISTDLMREFSLNAKQLGYLSATYLLADVIFLLPAGLLIDRFSTRTIILVALSLAVSSTFLFSISHSVWIVGICHFFAGMGHAFSFLSCTRLAARWFSAKQMGLIIGVIVTFALLGGMVAQTPLVLLNEAFGWRLSMLWIAALGVVSIFIVMRYVKDYPQGYQQTHDREQQQLQSIGLTKGIVQAICNRQNWLCGGYACFLNLPNMLLGALWGNVYLTQVEKLNTIQAGNIIITMFFGMLVGGPVLGYISDRIGQRRTPMIVCGFLSLFVMVTITIFNSIGVWPLAALFFTLGFFTSGQVLSYPVIAESNPQLFTGAAMGFGSILIMGGAGLFQPIFGWMMDLNWQGAMVGHTRLYPIEAFNLAMWIMPVAFVAAICISFFIKETHCRPKR
ncbi:MAG: MFS transporter [Gammaproteobacteria bacterium]